MDVREYNRRAWDAEVERGNRWTVPVTDEIIERARQGDWQVVLTPVKPVPREWFPPLSGLRVLGLAASGGQQGPVLAAAGARVTVLDNSPKQLERDLAVARRHGLDLQVVEGDMANLHTLESESFDLVFHPCSNCFVPSVLPVWREAFRVLRPGGALLAGFLNPVAFLFDPATSRGPADLVVRHAIPYSPLQAAEPSLAPPHALPSEPLAFGHTLQDQVGGQLDAGFLLERLFEDRWAPEDDDPLTPYIASFLATRAVRPARAG